MSGLRIVMITRRFWPLVGGAERMVASLAGGLARGGASVRILTARWEPAWPSELCVNEVPVARLPQSPRRFWGTWQYMRGLKHWLRAHRDEYDLVYVSMLKHDAWAALGAAPRGVPVVLRAEGAGRTGDCRWQREANFGALIRRRCRRAAGVIAPSPAIAEELRQAGFAAEKIHFIPNGVPVPPRRTADARARARTALGEAQVLLKIPTEAPLAVYTGRLHRDKGLSYLVQAWREVVDKHPTARLWLVGDGPERTALDEQIRSLRLWGKVLLIGTFDQVDDVLAAADVFALPSCEEGMSLALLEAMAAGLPVVGADIPGNRVLIDDGQQGQLVAPRDSAALADAIVGLLDAPARAEQLGRAARQRVESEFSLERCIALHGRLFQRLLQRESS